MADPTPLTPATPATAEFNKKVAQLIKDATPDDIVHILKDEASMAVMMHQNNNNMV